MDENTEFNQYKQDNVITNANDDIESRVLEIVDWNIYSSQKNAITKN